MGSFSYGNVSTLAELMKMFVVKIATNMSTMLKMTTVKRFIFCIFTGVLAYSVFSTLPLR